LNTSPDHLAMIGLCCELGRLDRGRRQLAALPVIPAYSFRKLLPST
jgi:hypothetical protein